MPPLWLLPLPNMLPFSVCAMGYDRRQGLDRLEVSYRQGFQLKLLLAPKALEDLGVVLWQLSSC